MPSVIIRRLAPQFRTAVRRRVVHRTTEKEIATCPYLNLAEVTADPVSALHGVTSRLDALWDTFNFYRVRVR